MEQIPYIEVLLYLSKSFLVVETKPCLAVDECTTIFPNLF